MGGRLGGHLQVASVGGIHGDKRYFQSVKRLFLLEIVGVKGMGKAVPESGNFSEAQGAVIAEFQIFQQLKGA